MLPLLQCIKVVITSYDNII